MSALDINPKNGKLTALDTQNPKNLLEDYSNKKNHMQYGSQSQIRLDEFKPPDYMKIEDDSVVLSKE